MLGYICHYGYAQRPPVLWTSAELEGLHLVVAQGGDNAAPVTAFVGIGRAGWDSQAPTAHHVREPVYFRVTFAGAPLPSAAAWWEAVSYATHYFLRDNDWLQLRLPAGTSLRELNAWLTAPVRADRLLAIYLSLGKQTANSEPGPLASRASKTRVDVVVLIADELTGQATVPGLVRMAVAIGLHFSAAHVFVRCARGLAPPPVPARNAYRAFRQWHNAFALLRPSQSLQVMLRNGPAPPAVPDRAAAHVLVV